MTASSGSPIELSCAASSLVASPSGLGARSCTHTHNSQGRFSSGTSSLIPRSMKMDAGASLMRAK
jgi:hypothetical protein